MFSLIPTQNKTWQDLWKRHDELFKETDDLFSSLFKEDNGPSLISYGNFPKVNIIDNDGYVKIEAELVGYSKDQISIELNNDALIISGKKEEKEEKGKYLVRELKRSSFKRSFTLGNKFDYDKITSTFENGILYINIPKKEEVTKPNRRIEIK